MEATTNIETITTDQIESAYKGKPGKCCCGCSGKYWYTDKHAQLAAERFAKVNDRQVARILAIFKANATSAKILSSSCVSLDLDGFVYVLHLTK